MRKIIDTIKTEEETIFDIWNKKADSLSHKIIEEINQEIQTTWEEKIWLERQIYEEAGLKPERDYTIEYFKRRKK